MTPLHIAIEKNNVEIVKLLLAHPNINVNAKYIVLILIRIYLISYIYFINNVFNVFFI